MTSIGALTASIAHEVTQTTRGNRDQCGQLLDMDGEGSDQTSKGEKGAERIVKDGHVRRNSLKAYALKREDMRRRWSPSI